MALLRLSDGRVYTTIEDIAPHVGTVRIGSFAFSDEFRRQVDAMPVPLSAESIGSIYAGLDPAAVAQAESEGLVHRRVGCVVAPSAPGGSFVFAFGAASDGIEPQTMSEVQLREYTVPHVMEAVDWHFVLSGAIVKGLELANGLQGVLYVQPGEWVCLNPEAVNWPIFPYGQATIGFSYFDAELGTFGQTNFPNVKIKPEMLY